MKLGNYKNLKVKKADTSVSREELFSAFDALQKENSLLIHTDSRPAREGDKVILDFHGYTADGQSIPNSARKKFRLTLGSHSFIPGFEEQIIGKMPGTEFDIPLRFPNNYSVKTVAGKNAVFHINLLFIEEQVLQELDDEFARDFSDFDTFEALSEEILQNLTDKKEEQAAEQIRQDLLTQIIKDSDLELNDQLLAQLQEELRMEFDEDLKAQGMSEEVFLRRTHKSPDYIDRKCMEKAQRRLQETMVLNAIADRENLCLTENELSDALEELAEEYNVTVSEFSDMLDPDELEGLKLELLCNKAMDFICSRATVLNEDQTF